MKIPNWLRKILGLPDPTLVDPTVADLQARLAAAEAAAATSRLHAMDATRQLQQSIPAPLSPGVATPTATVATANPPAPTLAAADAGNVIPSFPNRAALDAWVASQPQNVGLDFVWLKKDGVGGIAFYTQPDGTITTKQPSAPVVQAPTPVAAEDDLTKFLRRIGVADSLFGPIHAFAYTQPGTVTYTEIVKAFAAGPKPGTASDYDWAVLNRAAQLLIWEQTGAWVPNTPTLTLDGRTYDTKSIYDRFMALTDQQRSVVLQSNVIVGNAVEAWLGRTNETKAFLGRYLDGGDLCVIGGGSYDNATGRVLWMVGGVPHEEIVAPLF